MPGVRRSSRARALRASREPGAAETGRRPRREREPAPARRTDFRPISRGCGATSDERTAGPSRSRSNRWSAPTLSGPTGSRWTRSGPSACSSPDGRPPSTQPASKQHQHLVLVEPAQRKRQRARRGRVEPLDVVDSDQDRRPIAQKLQHVVHRHRERTAIDGITRRLLPKQRDLERTPPRRRNAGRTSSRTSSNRSPSPT